MSCSQLRVCHPTNSSPFSLQSHHCSLTLSCRCLPKSRPQGSLLVPLRRFLYHLLGEFWPRPGRARSIPCVLLLVSRGLFPTLPAALWFPSDRLHTAPLRTSVQLLLHLGALPLGANTFNQGTIPRRPFFGLFLSSLQSLLAIARPAPWLFALLMAHRCMDSQLWRLYKRLLTGVRTQRRKH